MADIDDFIGSGSCVLSASDEAVLEIIKKAVEGGISASFYVSRGMAEAITSWYWTPERIRETGVEEVSTDELRRIEKELGLKDVIHFANRTPCENCGHVYGAFEFIEQGLREHGREMVEATLEMKETALIRVNPSEVSVCPKCNEKITEGALKLGERIIGGTPVGHHYGGTSAYAGCCRLT
ncbi:hypothetical protein [Streptomyces sp. NPDC059008]|uniref:hypothetical protein n=1 Tax=Streptomyces sp. NPDC059008 TaxID=3346693 RepID=UPI003690FCA5